MEHVYGGHAHMCTCGYVVGPSAHQHNGSDSIAFNLTGMIGGHNMEAIPDVSTLMSRISEIKGMQQTMT